MKTSIAFLSSTTRPLFENRTTFGGMVISNYYCSYDADIDMLTENCDLINEQDYLGSPSLLATLADDMRYWGDFRTVANIEELYSLVVISLSQYTSDLSKCVEWDDFDDYLTLLLVARDEIKRGKVEECDLTFFNF